ncbi:hypothetical protein EJ04DRAFT_512381 [Polyplosphaeria fusca]|uniref:Uncharacterized protein n=1 Tax=Polyplosphaeria fusca TaxID=682080 RepID=A0A9P4R1C3_9PLEO|nr:hypothetical protein EJ04DRAFT_512381 [Polyplosphaeria fusca]
MAPPSPQLDIASSPSPPEVKLALPTHDNASESVATASLLSAEAAPNYEPLDASVRSFRLDAPFIYTDSIPRYQLFQKFTEKSHKPRKLCVRRLMTSEMRRHVLPVAPAERLEYNEDGTMYSMQVIQMFGDRINFGGREMRGHRESTLNGYVALETGKTVLGTKFAKFWHCTRNRERDSLRPENEARLRMYGYKPESEWDQKLLFMVKRSRWEDEGGKEVARDDGLDFTIGEGVIKDDEGWKRDLLVSCWVWKMWIVEGLRWEGDIEGM